MPFSMRSLPRNQYAFEFLFGPPSELINVSEFIQETSGKPHLYDTTKWFVAEQQAIDDYLPERREALEKECSVAEIKADIEASLDDVKTCIELMRESQDCIEQAMARKDQSKSAPVDPQIGKSKEKKGIHLASWDLPHEAHYFIRGIKNGDVNSLKSIKYTPGGASLQPDHPEVLLTFSIYTPATWAPGSSHRIASLSPPSRTSQHVLLSSQTLDDLFRVMPCMSKILPEQIIDDGTIIGYTESHKPLEYVMVAEGIAYGDGNSNCDYAHKLMEHHDKMAEDKRHNITKSPKSSRETLLSTLSLRINEPYWILHQGNSERFFILDSIRLQHPTDPPAGYPLTLFMASTPLDMCRACTKVPGTVAIVGDVRLGESPCVLCDPCWHVLRSGKDESVVEIPMPRYEDGF